MHLNLKKQNIKAEINTVYFCFYILISYIFAFIILLLLYCPSGGKVFTIRMKTRTKEEIELKSLHLQVNG